MKKHFTSLLLITFSFSILSLTIGCAKSNTDTSSTTPTEEEDEDPTPAPAHKYRVFVTSTAYQGNLGGLAGGDTICATRATAGGMTGTWKAWLSDSSTDAISRIVDRSPWYTPDEATVVVSSYSQLSTSGSNITIGVDELGGDALSLGLTVMTGTWGTGLKAPQNCSDWTSNISGGPSNQVRVGFVGGTGATWTTDSNEDCNQQYSIYCFEQ